MTLGSLALAVACACVLVWLAVFVLSCLLLAWANTPAVIASCGGFWEFMVSLATLWLTPWLPL
jgi:hypothetical protein